MGDIPSATSPAFWHIDYNDLTIQEEIGSGSFGKIHKADYLGTVVAVKTLSRDPTQDAVVLRFVQREVEILKYNHPNIVSLIGIAETGDDIHLVTEYVSGGDLSKYLRTPAIPLPWLIRIRIAIDVAAAMAYLHSKNIIHRDLKSKNCLVSDNWKIKLCDFGFARKAESKSSFMTICGTDEWMAPEVLTGAEYDMSADVFSFGILLSEIIARKRILHIAPRSPVNFFAFNETDFSKHVPSDTPPQLKQLASQCCFFYPKGRPTFREIIGKLRELELTLGGGPVSVSLSSSQGVAPPTTSLTISTTSPRDNPQAIPENLKPSSPRIEEDDPKAAPKKRDQARKDVLKQLVDEFLKAPLKSKKKDDKDSHKEKDREKDKDKDKEHRRRHDDDDVVDKKKSSKSPREKHSSSSSSDLHEKHNPDRATEKDKKADKTHKKHSPENERRHSGELDKKGHYSPESDRKHYSPEKERRSDKVRKEREREREREREKEREREEKLREKEEKLREKLREKEEKAREKEEKSRAREKEKRERKRSQSVKKERRTEERLREKELRDPRRRSMSLGTHKESEQREFLEREREQIQRELMQNKKRSVTFSF